MNCEICGKNHHSMMSCIEFEAMLSMDKKIADAELAGYERGMREAAEIVGKESWHLGVPSKREAKTWFIAKLDDGQRVVLRSLPEEFSYDYTTADETYYKAFRIKAWMPFWDGEQQNPLEAAILSALTTKTKDKG
jgi:hypothetical protein